MTQTKKHTYLWHRHRRRQRNTPTYDTDTDKDKETHQLMTQTKTKTKKHTHLQLRHRHRHRQRNTPTYDTDTETHPLITQTGKNSSESVLSVAPPAPLIHYRTGSMHGTKDMDFHVVVIFVVVEIFGIYFVRKYCRIIWSSYKFVQF